MAEQTLNARFQLKYDTLENWQKADVTGQGANLVLKKGEIAFCEIPTDGGKVGQETPPATMCKVGDGTSKFSELPWLTALAGDVYAWAKKSGIETEISGNGSFVKNVEWNATTNKLKITKGNVDLSGYVPTSRTIAGKNLAANISAADMRTALNVADGATKVTTETVSGWGYTKNTGTVTGVKMNGATKTPSSGVVDLGTVITSHQDISSKQNKTISLSDFTATTVETALSEAKKAGTDAATAAATAQTTANGKYSKPSGGIPKSDLASTVQTSLGKADTALQSHQSVSLASGTNNGTVKLTVNGTATDNIAVKGLAAAAYKGVDTAVTASSSNVVTSGAVKTYVDTQVSGVVKYMGTVDNVTTLGALTPDSKGDFCRASTAFTMTAALSSTSAAVYVHASDMLVCEAVKGKDSATATTYSIIHGEIDSNTWVANTVNAAGYVAAPTTSNKNKVWKTDADGNPGWRTDDNTDTKVTSAANHYAPSADTTAALAASASSTTAATWNSTSLVTGVHLQRDAKGHVVGVTVDSTKMPSNPNVDTNTAHNHSAGIGLIGSGTAGTSGTYTYKAALKSETKNANAALAVPAANANRLYPVEADKDGKLAVTVPWTDTQKSDATINGLIDTKLNTYTTNHPGVNKTGTVTSVSAGTGLKITGTASTTPTVGFDDSVTFVFNGGSSTVNV